MHKTGGVFKTPKVNTTEQRATRLSSESKVNQAATRHHYRAIKNINIPTNSAKYLDCRIIMGNEGGEM